MHGTIVHGGGVPSVALIRANRARRATLAVVTTIFVGLVGCSSPQRHASQTTPATSAASTATSSALWTSAPSPTATTVAATSSTRAADAELTLAGYRGMRFGMTPAEAGAALGTPPITGPHGNATCADVSFAGLPSGLTLYVIGGRIVAAEIVPGSSVTAQRGTHIGSTVDEVRRALGTDVVAKPSDVPTRTDLVYRTSDPTTAGNEIRYVAGDGKVFDILAGLRTYVDQQELCG